MLHVAHVVTHCALRSFRAILRVTEQLVCLSTSGAEDFLLVKENFLQFSPVHVVLGLEVTNHKGH